MSTRVDEKRDAQRAAEQKAMEKAAAKKQAEHSRQFERVMQGNNQQTGQQRLSQHDRQRQAQERAHAAKSTARQQAGNLLSAKQGIATQSFRSSLERAGAESLQHKTASGTARREELTHDRDTVSQRDEAHTEEARGDQRKLERAEDRLAPIDRDDPRHGDGGDLGGDQEHRGDGSDGKGRQPGDAAIAGLGLTTGAGDAAAAQALGSATQDPQVAQMIAQIIKHAMQGVDAKGLGVMHVELKDDVLAGARLTITAGDGGVSLKVATHDEQVARLLGSGQTAHELQEALRERGLRLNALVVNNDEVLRS